MANETSKSTRLRGSLNHVKTYFQGKGLDIGAGDDPLITPYGTVDVFDTPQGDAQLLSSVTDNTYDFIYSSHCLEHMRDVEEALKNWCRVLKPSGYLFITVPDWTLYEHETWPSRFNADHKHVFTTDSNNSVKFRSDVRSYDNFNIGDILEQNKVKLIEMVMEDEGFDYSLPSEVDQTNGLPALCQIRIIGQKFI